MRRVKIPLIIFIAVLFETAVHSQNHEHILNFIGTSSAEDLNQYDAERLEDLLSNSLRINLASESGLAESGLFTRYQIASLTDYRSRHGDVMSMMELAAIDGFSHDFVTRLAPFISLESGWLPGKPAHKAVRNDISARIGIKREASLTYGLKYKLTVDGRLTGGLSISRTSSAARPGPDAFSGHLAFHLKRRQGKILVGDFNARFGQGLALWNGMSFSGLTSASTFMKRPSGISPSSSFTGGYAMRGFAADIRVGHAGISFLTAASRDRGGITIFPAMNFSWFFQNAQLSMTHYADFLISDGARIPDMKTSVDFAACFAGKDLYSEIVYDWVSSRAAVLGGTSVRIGEDVQFSAMARYYPSGYSSVRSAAARSGTACSNEYGASVAADFSAGRMVSINGAEGFGSAERRFVGKASADCAYFPVSKSSEGVRSFQIKAQGELAVLLSGAFKITGRISERVRTWGNPFRTDIRADISYISRHVVANLRMNALHCVDAGLLGFVEGGYKAGRISVYLRQGIFKIDKWEDRIYAYERDAPGSFNVPAFYGRGIWTAFTMNWKFAGWGRLYARAAVTEYIFMKGKKPGRAELKFQLVFSFR